jgi:VanZ family protein
VAPARPRSSAGALALVYALLVVYASLYPFVPWRWPPGVAARDALWLPWPPWRDAFDVAANVAGYLPLGALLAAAQLRAGRRALPAWALAILAATALAYALELTQLFVAGRVPSRVDWALNAGGAAAGATLVLLLDALGLTLRWQALRERWFVADSAGGLALLALWPVALLWPAPAPLALGPTGPPLREGLLGLLHGVPWAEGLAARLAAAPAAALPPLAELLVPMLGLLAPCLVALNLARRGWRRGLLVLGAFGIALGMSTLSTALAFGPAHALAWATPLAVPAMLGGALLALGASWLDARAVAGIGLGVLGALVVLVVQAPVDPYYAAHLQQWELGRFIRFNGLAQWIGWLWPFAAIVWLLGRLGRAAE